MELKEISFKFEQHSDWENFYLHACTI